MAAAGRFQMAAAGSRRGGWIGRGWHEVDPPDGPTRPQESAPAEAYGAGECAGECVGAAEWLELFTAAAELSGSSAASM